MTDLGILLTDRLAQAAHDGRKTVTRRPVDATGYRWLGLGPCSDDAGPVHPARRCERHEGVLHGHINSFNWANFNRANIRGAGTAKVGGRVWIRESFWCARRCGHIDSTGEYVLGPWTRTVHYGLGAADGQRDLGMPEIDFQRYYWRRRPSIHMPKWAARTWGRIVSVRPERLQDITDADAKREGFTDGLVAVGMLPHVAAFRSTWNDCYAARGLGWDANPWVWRIEWERIGRPEVTDD